MQPEDKRCSKLETHTFFLSFFQDGVVLVSGPRNSLCAWTSILACFYSLPKHLCFILVTYKMPYILILTGGRGGAAGSVLQVFPGLLPSLIHFNGAPKASPGIWGGVSVLHLLPPPTHPVAPSRPFCRSRCPILLAPPNILGSLGSKQEAGQVQGSALTEERTLLKVKPTGFPPLCFCSQDPASGFSFPACQAGLTHLPTSQRLGSQNKLHM